MECRAVVLMLAVMVTSVESYIVLQERAYIQLNDASGQKTINASTYNRLAYDFGTDILYVTAREPGRLTVFRMATDGTPNELVEYAFNTGLEGQPLDVEFCRPETAGGVPRVAISFTDPVSDSAEGVVRLYDALTPTNTALNLLSEVTVGSVPIDIEFGQDCTIMLVANRGTATREGNLFRDPEGTVSKISLPMDLNPGSSLTVSTISFSGYFEFQTEEILVSLREKNFRYYPIRDANGNLLTVSQNIEPENVVMAPNGRVAYVSMPKNNAVARLNLETNLVSSIFPLGNRSWTDYYLDPSDQDGGVHMDGYNIYGLYQATEMAWITNPPPDNRQWIVTLDSGVPNNIGAYGYADYERAQTMMNSGSMAISPTSELGMQMLNNSQLGRLYVSKEDGRREDGLLETVYAFGGRGFSIHDANDFSVPSAVVDSIEQMTAQFYPNVFNTNPTSLTSTPQADKDMSSPTLGPDLAALEVADHDGKRVMFLGGRANGMIYVYALSADATCPQPFFHSVHRRGSSVFSYTQAFNQATLGDIGINDILYVSSQNVNPTLIVAASFSNSVSTYNLQDTAFP